MLERGIDRQGLTAALAAEPRLGTTTGTAIYSHRGIKAVVDAETGMIVTLWWIA